MNVGVGRPFSPSVRLSPKAMKRVALRTSGVTLTEKAQAAWRPRASVTTQPTGVVPERKREPEAGVQVTASGRMPPVAAGAG